MKTPAASIRGMTWALLAVLCLAGAAPAEEGRETFDPGQQRKGAPAKPKPKPAVKPKPKPSAGAKTLPERIDRMVEYFIELYGKSLKSRDWVKRAMAVVSLARIDDTRVTDRLLTVIEKDRGDIVRIYAWEAIHARTKSLSDQQRKRWLAAGWKLAPKGAFRGDLRIGLAGVLASAPPAAATRKVFARLFDDTSLSQAKDIRVIAALRSAVSQWRDRKTIKALIAAMGDINNAYRAEYVLSGLLSGVPRSSTYIREGTKPMWAKTKQAWEQWLSKADLKSPAADAYSPYRGTSQLLGAPEKITDPSAAKWHKDLEIGDLKLRHFDVTFVVDSTGSMKFVLTWIKRDVVKMMRAFGMIAREPRIDVTFYRDHGDAYVTQVHRLTGDGAALAKAIAGARAAGGGRGDIPEAVYEALHAATTKQKWSRSSDARKIVVLIGDAGPHPETMDKIKKLLAKYTKKGFTFHCAKARTTYGAKDLSSLDKIAAWGGGSSMSVNFRSSIYSSSAKTSGPGQIVREVLKSVLSENYHSRTEAFVNVLLEYLEVPVPERRSHRGPIVPRQPQPNRPRQPRKPRPPYDPQKR